MKKKTSSAHSEACLAARAKIKQSDLDKLDDWIDSHPAIEFEVSKGRDLYFIIGRIAYLAGVSFVTVARRVSGTVDKWKGYRTRNWSPRLRTLQELMGALRIEIKIKPEGR